MLGYRLWPMEVDNQMQTVDHCFGFNDNSARIQQVTV